MSYKHKMWRVRSALQFLKGSNYSIDIALATWPVTVPLMFLSLYFSVAFFLSLFFFKWIGHLFNGWNFLIYLFFSVAFNEFFNFFLTLRKPLTSTCMDIFHLFFNGWDTRKLISLHIASGVLQHVLPISGLMPSATWLTQVRWGGDSPQSGLICTWIKYL